MIFARFVACLTLVLLAHPASAQTRQALPTPSRPPASQTLAPRAQPSPVLSDSLQTQRDDARRETAGSDPSQTQFDEARRDAETAQIDQATNEARDQANQRMNAATAGISIGVSSVAGQIVTGAPAAQRPAQQAQDIETQVQQVLMQSAREADADLRDNASAAQRENRRRRALREQTECPPNVTNAGQCPCPSGTLQVNGQCAAGGN